ncbi:PspA/IM30 family protein [Nitrosococcus halophilus Nc 4]|uniref:PspA/IM30 family protein n=1 Tax=Nitrosococcus halophilus (strain Nc4) TaxID=472759 RepID=D5BUN1_NITHN|nr:PspA/IM30 family protein [Nitrosococcus halophilus]ADE13431.1 PspA/IM30 family protein [Nitrosococcus halophilus Nc 4]
MGLLSRMATILKAKMNALLESSANPAETLEYSYQKQVELLQKVKRGIVEVVTSKRRVELQAARVREQVSQLDAQAEEALAAGREDLARLALQRKQIGQEQLGDLEQQLSVLEQEQQRLTTAETRLSTKVETFRTRKETLKAQYTAAEAQVRIGEAVHGLSEELADMGLAIERAEEKTESMRARAAAIDELAETGVLVDLTRSGEDQLSRELKQISASRNVEAELAAMKERLGQ